MEIASRFAEARQRDAFAGGSGSGAFGNDAGDCAPAECRHSSRQEIATKKRTASLPMARRLISAQADGYKER